MYFDILWPEEKQITENVLNNNSIVAKLNYCQFSMLFVGDIEKIAEEKIIGDVNLKDKLKSDVLKVGHHGSKTSTTAEFLELVNPKLALIGVGENNTFGHPSDEVIKRLEDSHIKVFRTDICGEIEMKVTKDSKIQIKTKIKSD